VRNSGFRAFGIAALAALALTPLAQAASPPDFTQLFNSNKEAVVNISTTQKVKVSPFFPENPFPGLPKDDPFNQFFRRFFGGPQGVPRERKVQSLGSGFVVSNDGYILTNAHVVGDAQRIIVRLFDHRELRARVVGLDKQTDVALLKVEAANLPAVKIGNSDKLEVGEWVLAIGSPFGLDYTATQGIISALQRSLPEESYVPFIQTDVPVNPGNSGGPLIDPSGEVVGINAQIYSTTGGYMGLSFAVPINVTMRVADQIKSHGHATHGWLGVMIQPLTEELAHSFGMKNAMGALVAQVTPGSPAAKAGLKQGDVILRYNGVAVEGSEKLPPLVNQTPIGKTVPLEIFRNGGTHTVQVTIQALREKVASSEEGGAQPSESSAQAARLNIEVADLTEAQRQKLGVGDRGVMVESVQEGPTADAGVQPGDVLLRLNNHDIKSVAGLADIVKHLPKGKPVPVLIQREDTPMFLTLTLS